MKKWQQLWVSNPIREYLQMETERAWVQNAIFRVSNPIREYLQMGRKKWNTKSIVSFKPYKGVSSNQFINAFQKMKQRFKPYKGVSSNRPLVATSNSLIVVSNPIREYLQIRFCICFWPIWRVSNPIREYLQMGLGEFEPVFELEFQTL